MSPPFPHATRLRVLTASLLLVVSAAARVDAGTPASSTFYYTTFGSSNVYGAGSFSWDGTSALSVNTAQRAALPGFAIDGSLVVAADGNIYSGRAGTVYQINPSTNTFRGASSGVNNNVTSIDPARTTVYAGWKDTPLATLATGGAFGPGTAHPLTGSDTVATGLAWDANGTVWYTTGGEAELGNVGTINLSTFNTTRRLTGISATSITFDPFTGHLFTAGIDGIAQIDPANATVVSTWKNPQGGGKFIDSLAVTGKGHLVAFDSSNLLRIWDFSSGSRLIGNADTIKAAVATTVNGGGLAFAAVAPSIVSPLTVTATVGVPFFYQIVVIGQATGYTAANLPAGLTLNTSLGVISGTPTQAGNAQQVSLTATDATGTAAATLTINVQPTPPLVIQSSTAVTARAGQPFKFQVFTTGGSANARLSANGLPAGLSADAITGVISGMPGAAGSFNVTLTVTDAGNTTTQTLELTVSADLALPVIISPTTATITRGQAFTYTIQAPTAGDPNDPTTYVLFGNLPAGLGFDPKSGTISGTVLAMKNGSDPAPHALSGGIVGNVQLFARNSTGTGTIPLVFFSPPIGTVNISTRMSVGTGDDVMIAGFIITGNAPKAVVLRAIGGSLSAIPAALKDTILELHDKSGATLATNDDWRQTQENEIIGTGIPPTDPRESAMIASLTPSNYTAIVRGKDSTTGISVVEAYDVGTASLDVSSQAQLAQISTRGKVLTGDDVMIGGFIVSTATKVLVRAIGPELNATVPNALQDPTLELHDGSGTVISSNDDWRSTQEQAIKDTTVPPTDDRESAIVATLSPGAYTGVVRGKGGTTGVALVEIYSLP